MTILIVMIPLSILLLIGAGIAFFWAVDHDQFDDMQTPALLPLLDLPDTPDALDTPEVTDAGATPDPARKPPR